MMNIQIYLIALSLLSKVPFVRVFVFFERFLRHSIVALGILCLAIPPIGDQPLPFSSSSFFSFFLPFSFFYLCFLTVFFSLLFLVFLSFSCCSLSCIARSSPRIISFVVVSWGAKSSLDVHSNNYQLFRITPLN
eukprot:TRINITY_DN7722_c0_g1_i1.p1 TRINITY_DN7722_c0_g1~~TRINITY_DN7722_c0_g1_i1.p1  ORF type:complete len:134 (+),score=18.33 TRINITY_DN7722_c0_g1_i1:62-463(+)